MNLKRVSPLLIFALLLVGPLLQPIPGRAFNTEACHCFRHREYDPKAPFAADDYLLATSFNSLTSAYFRISKKQLIRYKMKGGIRQDDLLIALYLAQTKKLDLEKLLAARASKTTWKQMIATFPTLDKDHKDPLIAKLRNSRPADECETYVGDRMIADFYGLTPASVSGQRNAGLNEKELTLLFFLARTRKIPPEKLIEQVKKEGRSWSEVAFYLGLTPKEVGQQILNYRK